MNTPDVAPVAMPAPRPVAAEKLTSGFSGAFYVFGAIGLIGGVLGLLSGELAIGIASFVSGLLYFGFANLLDQLAAIAHHSKRSADALETMANR